MAQLVEQRNTSFLLGATDSAPAMAMGEGEASLLLNHWTTPDGEAQVRYGSKRLHSTALNLGAQGFGIFPFTTSGGIDQLVAFAGDSAYYSADEGATWTLITGGLRQDYWSAATMSVGGISYLYLANGSTNLYRWDGSALTNFAGPVSGCTRLAVHNERLWTTNGVNVYASKVADPATWTAPDGVTVPFNTHDGDTAILALYAMGPWLLVFKRGSFGYIEGYGNADVISNAGSRGISRDVGCIAPRSLIGVGGNGLMWMSRRGFEFYSPGGQPVVVSRSVENFLTRINTSDIEATPGIPCAFYYPQRNAYVCSLPGIASRNDHRFVYRLPLGDRPGAASVHDSASASGQSVQVVNGFLEIGGAGRLRTRGGFLEVVTGSTPGVYADVSSGFLALATNNTTEAAVCSANLGTTAQVPVAIGYDGFVRKLDTGIADDLLSDGTGGTAIVDQLKGRKMVFGDPFRKKRARTARVLLTAERPVTPSVRVIGDEVNGTAHTLDITGTAPVEKRVRVSVRAKELLVEVSNAGAGTKIGGVAIGAEPLAERP